MPQPWLSWPSIIFIITIIIISYQCPCMCVQSQVAALTKFLQTVELYVEIRNYAIALAVVAIHYLHHHNHHDHQLSMSMYVCPEPGRCTDQVPADSGAMCGDQELRHSPGYCGRPGQPAGAPAACLETSACQNSHPHDRPGGPAGRERGRGREREGEGKTERE